jgi:hypothetical protein
MARKIPRVPVKLDAKGIRQLSQGDLVAILRAADPLIMSGGRTMLSKILKGSGERKVVDLKLNTCPAFGYFRNLNSKEIFARIDWTILNGYLALEYSGRLPLLTYTPQGWDIEKDTYSDELLMTIKDLASRKCEPDDLTFLKDKNRSLIWRLLEKIATSQDSSLVPALELWKEIDYKKVRERIHEVIRVLHGKATTG